MTVARKNPSPDFSRARANMIESQIRPNKVRDERILSAMETLPREMFVPGPMAGIAYIDEDLQVATGRYLLEPMVLARLLEEAQIKPSDHVLDVAPATGYSTALLSAIAKTVVGVEIDPLLQQQAVSNLASMQADNAEIHLAHMPEGYKEKAPYDVILINGGVEFVPEALTVQLAEGGRLLAIVRQYGPAHAAHVGEARLYEKIHGMVSYRDLFDANVKLLPGFQLPKKFTF